MATEQQVQSMLDLMQQQMTAFKALQDENARLRDEAAEVASQERNNAPASAPTTPSNENHYKAKKPDRPKINGGLDDREWALFLDSWERYKVMVNVTDVASIRMELRAACSEDVNKLLFEYVGAPVLNASTENNLLQHIKDVAVKSVHKEVHQVAFNNMSQNIGEPVTNYVARLKAKAFLCGFEVTCTDHDQPTTISYAEQMVAQRLIAGLCNQEHQRKVLAEAPSLVTLSDKVNRLHMLETTEESVSMLHKSPPPPSSEAAIGRSVYKQGKSGPNVVTKCRWCGRTAHPQGKSMDRANCPAKNKECNNCHKTGHFGDVCEKARTDSADTNQPQPVVTDSDSSLTSIPSAASVSFSFGAQDFRLGRKPNDHT